jgi:hypothetical protein
MAHVVIEQQAGVAAVVQTTDPIADGIIPSGARMCSVQKLVWVPQHEQRSFPS